jgi:outer membrane protein assembly factor BamB
VTPNLRLASTAAVALLAGALDAQSPAASVAERNWGQWRGPHATGVSKTANPPLQWSETRNIRWKVPLPGRGAGSPVVWNDRVYVTTAIPADGNTSARAAGVMHRFLVMALDRQTGKVVWERLAREEAPHEPGHAENATFASGSVIADGEHVIAYFESRGLYVYDMNGNLVWEKDLGDKHMRNQFGEGHTPVLSGDHLVVVWDHLGGPSYIYAFDKNTGRELWQQSRGDTMDTWATPVVVEVNGRRQVVVGAMEHIRSYDLETGEVVWHTSGLTMNVIPSPVAEDDLVVLMSGFRGNMAKAIRLSEARGDITNTPAVLWTFDRDTPYVPSPLLYDGILYMLKTNNNLLSTFDARTGKPHYPIQRIEELPQEVFSSPVGAAGRVYITGREGTTVVLKHGTTYDVLGVNRLDDRFDGSAALVDGEIFLRGFQSLYKIAE